MSERASKRLLPSPAVCQRYAITLKTLWQWVNADFGFPAPVKIGGRNYWREYVLDVFDANLKTEKGRAPRRRAEVATVSDDAVTT